MSRRASKREVDGEIRKRECREEKDLEKEGLGEQLKKGIREWKRN